MPLDGLSLRYLAHELQHELVEGRIDKITHPKPNDVYFHIRSRGQTRRLVISIDAASARAHLTKNDPANPFKASGFLMFMRKHFSGGRIQTSIPSMMNASSSSKSPNEMKWATLRRKRLCRAHGTVSNLRCQSKRDYLGGFKTYR